MSLTSWAVASNCKEKYETENYLLWHKDGKNKKCRVLLTFDCLSKNVINGILIYNSAHFKELQWVTKIYLPNHFFEHLGSPFPNNQFCSHEVFGWTALVVQHWS